MQRIKNFFVLKFVAGLLCVLTFASCTPTFQYDVIVENKTNAPLQISFKSETDKRGAIQEVILLNAKERKRIISTRDIFIDDGSKSSSATHCKDVAEYFVATKLNGQKSKKAWCGKGIRFEKVDIQQGEFTIIYTPDDF